MSNYKQLCDNARWLARELEASVGIQPIDLPKVAATLRRLADAVDPAPAVVVTRVGVTCTEPLYVGAIVSGVATVVRWGTVIGLARDAPARLAIRFDDGLGTHEEVSIERITSLDGRPI